VKNGYSLVEIAIVATILLLILSLALPFVISSMRAYRASVDARSIAAQLALTKMRAAYAFTQARLNHLHGMVRSLAGRTTVPEDPRCIMTAAWQPIWFRVVERSSLSDSVGVSSNANEIV